MATSPDESAVEEMRPEYDFKSLKGAVRGKYAARFAERLRVVRLADDVAAAFADEAAVNAALREYLRTNGGSGVAKGDRTLANEAPASNTE